MLEINKNYNEDCLSGMHRTSNNVPGCVVQQENNIKQNTTSNTHIKRDKSKKSLDSDRDCALVCRCANTASNIAVENFAIKLLELQKRLEVANNE
jgi:hypothetical protein